MAAPEERTSGAVASAAGVSRASTAPMSMASPPTRGKPGPRWSAVSGWPAGSRAREVAPASIAGLPGTRDSVRVGPPLPDGVVCRTDDTLAPVTMFPFVPFTKPPEPPPPIRLFLLAAVSTTSPDELSYAPMSLAPVPARCRARSS